MRTSNRSTVFVPAGGHSVLTLRLFLQIWTLKRSLPCRLGVRSPNLPGFKEKWYGLPANVNSCLHERFNERINTGIVVCIKDPHPRLILSFLSTNPIPSFASECY